MPSAAARDLAERGHAEVDLTVRCSAVDLGDLVLGAGEADLESFDLAEPAFAFSFGDAGQQIVVDLDQPRPLGWVWSQERAADVPLTELT
ncbi:hypothetical protein ACFO9E_22175 [Streptomyces maoxianensis]|uniref:Uncharacterized protein n=1 Tax=Streptomyces maoxianensis TaxID=1459942 RepID=A0ABV9GCX3_9ACTN